MEELTEHLVSTSENLLLKYGQTTSQAHLKKLKDIVIVQLNGLYLKNVRHLQYCVLLKVCILSNNYITDIDALECCTNLVKLDLHGNQVNTFSLISAIHHSPVVIVQRWIRGYLTRKRFGYVHFFNLIFQDGNGDFFNYIRGFVIMQVSRANVESIQSIYSQLFIFTIC
uniref:Uncharacterized protein n=1 Tax=Gopherus evgoodei TaxID=1825980 RepID=A0A8C4VVM4_9SAUR